MTGKLRAWGIRVVATLLPLLLLTEGVRWAPAAQPLPGYADLVLADAPMAYWRLNDPDARQLADASGHGWTGTLLGGVSQAPNSPPDDGGAAIHFDGATGTALAPLKLSTQSAITVEFWMAWDSFADDDRLAFEFTTGNGTFQVTDGFIVDPNSAFWPGQFEVSLGDGSSQSYNSAIFARPPAGEWHQYAIVMDRSAPPPRQIIPYQDGSPVNFVKPPAYSRGPAPGHDRFADGVLSLMSRGGTDLFGAGALHDVAVYPQALPGSRIAEHFRVATGAAAPADNAPTDSPPPDSQPADNPPPVSPPADTPTPASPPPAVSPTTTTPDATLLLGARSLPSSAPELPNPLRGEYQWYGESVVPPGWPYQDSYTRYDWKKLERSPGEYDFSAIDAELSSAAARGGRFGFRVMSVCSGCGDGGVAVPAYLTTSSGGWYANVHGEKNFIPDWNNETYLSRWEALMQALGARYASDPRIGVIDIGGAGNWGEWHNSPYDGQYPGPKGQVPATDANARRIVEASLAAFPPGDHLLVIRTANSAAVRYALGRSARVGLRLDCLGGGAGMVGDREALANVWDLAAERWKTAPIVTEWCGNITPGSNRFQEFGLAQVQEFHVSMVSSGNFVKSGSGGLSAYSTAEQNGFVSATRLSGYRFVLDSLKLPSVLASTSDFAMITQWENVNVAPAYLSFNVMVQLRDSANTVAWQAKSALDLRQLLPTGGSPVEWTDHFSLGGLNPGTYQVAIQIVDPAQISPPLQLAIEGRQPDGSYPFGSIEVH